MLLKFNVKIGNFSFPSNNQDIIHLRNVWKFSILPEICNKIWINVRITTYQIPEGPIHKTEEFIHSIVFIVPTGTRDTHLPFFSKIAGALQAEIGDTIEFVEVGNNQSVSISKVHYPALKLIISFGIPVERMGMWIEIANEGICRLEAFDLILTLHPDKLDASQTAKRTLWQFMQQYLMIQEGES